MRKTSNILIRQAPKRSSRELPLPSTTSIMPKIDTKENADVVTVKQNKRGQQSRSSSGAQVLSNLQIQKEFVKAETLTEIEQMQINQQAKRTIGKKVKSSQNKIESELVTMLQQECGKLGSDLQKQKLTNGKLRTEIEMLRANICSLNEKLQKTHNDNSNLSKNQTEGKIQNKQLAQEMHRLKTEISKKQEHIKQLQKQNNNFIEELKNRTQSHNQAITKLEQQIEQIIQVKDTFKYELDEKNAQIQILRDTFIQKKAQWQAQQKQYENFTQATLEKKGEKLTKVHTDSIKLQEKLKQQEQLRKKVVEKNKELEKQLQSWHDAKKQLEQTIISLKKRINDLSILKSSNATILNQKISQLTQDNDKLRSEVSQLKGFTHPSKEPTEKPLLFGSNDFQ